MRALMVLAVLLIPFAGIGAASANDGAANDGVERHGAEPGTPSAEKAQRLDDLFAQLKAAPNEMTGREIEQKIWIEWTSPEDPELATLMDKALAARREADYDTAISILDHITQDWSGYAEGWNQRATVYFLKGEYEKSLIDIAETLKREPRHFGALAGRGLIRLKQGKPTLAGQNILKAMEYDPYLRERHLIGPLLGKDVPL